MVNIRNELGKLRNEVWNILQLDYSKRTGFIPSILGRIDGILETPKRNCDIGTADEQETRFTEFCDAHKYVGDDGVNVCSRDCPFYNKIDCGIFWSQMPYEKGENDE